MTCPWITPRYRRPCSVEDSHLHYPAWVAIAARDWPVRMMLLTWWRGRRHAA